VIASCVLAAACGGENTPDPAPSPPAPAPGDGGANATAIDNYLAGLGQLSSPEVPGSPVVTGVSKSWNQEIDDALAPSGRTHYDCTTTPYSLTTSPDKIVTFNPDAGKLWLGALLQGHGYAGPGSLQELPVAKRAPLRLFVDLLSPNVTADVEYPNAASVQSAIGGLVARAQSDQVPIPTVASFQQTSASTTAQGLLSLGLSAKFGGFKASGSLKFPTDVNESTVMASLVQRYFTVSIVRPSTPAAYFSSDFTIDDLDEQARLGRIGPDNPPVVVSSIAYGRIFVMAVTAKGTTEQLSAALNAEFSAGGNGGSIELSDEQKKMIQSARIEVVSNGGDEDAFREAVRTQKVDAIFARPSTITTARPISYQVDNIGNDSAARFTETTSYDMTDCAARSNTKVKVGAIWKLSGVSVYTDECDQYLYGTLRVNGQTILATPSMCLSTCLWICRCSGRRSPRRTRVGTSFPARFLLTATTWPPSMATGMSCRPEGASPLAESSTRRTGSGATLPTRTTRPKAPRSARWIAHSAAAVRIAR
jgi:hypothetical protein